jgi:hypothetical protein
MQEENDEKMRINMVSYIPDKNQVGSKVLLVESPKKVAECVEHVQAPPEILTPDHASLSNTTLLSHAVIHWPSC